MPKDKMIRIYLLAFLLIFGLCLSGVAFAQGQCGDIVTQTIAGEPTRVVYNILCKL